MNLVDGSIGFTVGDGDWKELSPNKAWELSRELAAAANRAYAIHMRHCDRLRRERQARA